MFKSFTANLPSGGRLPLYFRTDPGVPAPIRRAVRLMYAGAAASTLSLILTVIGAFSLKQNLIAANAQNLQDHKVTMSQISSAATFETTYTIVIGAAAVALWIWMAKMNEGGRPWARFSATAFFALWSYYTYSYVNAIKGGTIVSVSFIIVLVLLLALWAIGAATVYQLWRPASTAYFKAGSRTA